MENPNEITVKELNSLLEKMKKCLAVSKHSEQTIVNYLRAMEYMCKHTGKQPTDTKIAFKIPYPKEEQDLLIILSRNELFKLFTATENPKHKKSR